MNEHHIYIPNIPYVSLVSSLIQQHTNNADLYIRRVEQDLGQNCDPALLALLVCFDLLNGVNDGANDDAGC